MTEKAYGGSTGIPAPKDLKHSSSSPQSQKTVKPKNNQSPSSNNMTESTAPSPEEVSKLKKAGEISRKLKEYAREIAKPGIPLLEIANLIDSKIEELGAKPAFPVNLSINEIAAHATPSYNSEEKAHGLLKIDIGIHIDGYVADTAISIDLEKSEQNKKLIEAAEKALEAGIKTFSTEAELREIGSAIAKEITSEGFQPVVNLSGHSIDPYDLHSGITIPNVDNGQDFTLPEGVYAVEPFATTGHGRVKDGKPSGIYHLESDLPVRDPFAREVLAYIKEEFHTLPFCQRWLVKKFGSRAILALKRLEDAKILHHYPQLIESGGGIVAQAEHTIILTEKETIITT
jgi:methionyl aminopeptidase